MVRNTAVVSDYERELPDVAKDVSLAPRKPGCGQARGQLEARRQLEASLRSREAQMADAMKAEQRQWNETSARLDAVERELGARRD